MINQLLTVENVKALEQVAITAGISEDILMERAAESVRKTIFKKFSPTTTVVFCGPGKNGKDGKRVAQLLQERDWPVKMVELENLPPFEIIEQYLDDAWLIIDAIFGTGLNRPLEGDVLTLVTMINAARGSVLSIDIPTGIETDSGACFPEAIRARYTVSFFGPRLGHYLYPGREYRGSLKIDSLGVPDVWMPPVTTHLNDPIAWVKSVKDPGPCDHKYSRGACLVVATGCMPGAVRLATLAARRAGAGLLRVICKREEYPIYAATAWGEIITPVGSAEEFFEWIDHKNFKSLLWGVGTQASDFAREQALSILLTKKPCVLDGGALSSFADKTAELRDHLHENVVLTPHEGEFHRIFPHLAFLTNKAEKTLKAAVETGAVIVLKGNDTVIAAPHGQIIVNWNAPTTLATAGSGDVLAGMITSLLAQGVPPCQAASAAVWMHGEAANRKGPGLIAEDLPDEIPGVLGELRKYR